MAMYRDNWVKQGDGVEVNIPIPIDGKVVEKRTIAKDTYNSLFTIVTMDNGKIYERCNVYYEHSPYGWKEVK